MLSMQSVLFLSKQARITDLLCFRYAGLLTDLSDYIYLEPGRKYTPRLQYSSLVEHLVKVGATGWMRTH